MAQLCPHIKGNGNGECGKEIEGMYDPYCLYHMNQYKCTICNHTTTDHEDPETQEPEHCHKRGCKCKGYRGDLE